MMTLDCFDAAIAKSESKEEEALGEMLDVFLVLLGVCPVIRCQVI
jgi:hypothetical protein